MSCTVLAVGFPDLVNDAVMVAAALCADVHFNILCCRGVSSVASWTLSAWLPPWIRCLFTVYSGLWNPPFVLEAGPPVRGERTTRLPGQSLLDSVADRLCHRADDPLAAAQNLHRLLHAASSSVAKRVGSIRGYHKTWKAWTLLPLGALCNGLVLPSVQAAGLREGSRMSLVGFVVHQLLRRPVRSPAVPAPLASH